LSEEAPFPPGDYPVLVVGSGPGALQLTHDLTRLGVEHAVISQDTAPGGMFRRFPLLQRLITWSKPYAPVERTTRWYEWFDWNSLLATDDEHRALVPATMDGTSYFPSRPEMERGLAEFASRTGLRVRYGCRWEATSRTETGFEVDTTDGAYRCRVLVLAVGMTQPWVPDIPGIEEATHYVDMRPVEHYAGKRVFILGKRNSGFEIADGLLPWARQIILGSPRPARISVVAQSTASARARYLQPYEDALLGGGNLVLDVAVERFERLSDDGWRVHAEGTTRPGRLTIDVDEVVVATGFTTPLGDLPDLGLATFYSGRLPAQTPWWESASVPGIYFAGSITQGSIGLKKHGLPSNSAAVHGFRYNARVLAHHIATTHAGIPPATRSLEVAQVPDFLVSEVASDPALWHQQAYLCRVVELDRGTGPTDLGIVPLAHFLDSGGPDAVAATVETDGAGDIHPTIYVRHGGTVAEHGLPGDAMLDFGRDAQREAIAAILSPVLG
jgi:thioredoxin reductase